VHPVRLEFNYSPTTSIIESVMSFLTRAQKVFIEAMSDDSDTDVPHVSAHVPLASGRSTLLSKEQTDAIKNLSDDSEFEEYTIQKALERTHRLLDARHKLYTRDEFANEMKFSDVMTYIMAKMPWWFRVSFDTIITSLYSKYVDFIHSSRRGAWISRLRWATNWLIIIFSYIAHALYLLSFTWQILLHSMHTTLLYSDHFWNWLLNDRVIPHTTESQIVGSWDTPSVYDELDSKKTSKSAVNATSFKVVKSSSSSNGSLKSPSLSKSSSSN
jgi:hypothetical protein